MYNYGKHYVDNEDLENVSKILNNDTFLTCGPKVKEFEKKICDYTNCKYACAVNSCTSALHIACMTINISKDDEVIIPAISFAASSNCVLYCGGTPVFCDIDKNTMNIDINKIEELITPKTKALIVVDFAGQTNDYEKLNKLKTKYNLVLIQDAAHSIGAKYKDLNVGNIADITTFSFHPVKNMTTGEGGALTTNNLDYFKKMKLLRSHGLTKDFDEREKSVSHNYDIVSLGYNYRISDILCALGISQLNKLDMFVNKRKELVNYYNNSINNSPLNQFIEPLELNQDSSHHIYIIKIKDINLINRDVLFKNLHNKNIKVNVHYKPIYLFTLYQNLGYKKGLCINAEDVYNRIITMPLYFSLEKEDIDKILNILKLSINQVIKIKSLISKFKNIDVELHNYLDNDFKNGKDFCEYYLIDLYDQRSESIALRNLNN